MLDIVALKRAYEKAAIRQEKAARENGYRGFELTHMIARHGAYEATLVVMDESHVGWQQSLPKMWELRMLHLSFETLVLQDQWEPLFKLKTREIAAWRLSQFGCNVSRILIPRRVYFGVVGWGGAPWPEPPHTAPKELLSA